MLWIVCLNIALSALVPQSLSTTVVSFRDSNLGSYLKSEGAGHSDLTIEDLTATVTTLLNAAPLTHISASTSQKIGRIVKASPFDKPAAVALFTIAGAPTGVSVLSQGSAAHISSNGDAGSIVDAVLDLTQSGSIAHLSLDLTTLPSCGESCLEESLQETLRSLALDANYTKTSAVLRGQIGILEESNGKVCVLDLEKIPDRLFAVEVVSTWLRIAHLAEQEGLAAAEPQLVDRTLLSLQAIKEAYGASSPQYRVASNAMLSLLKRAISQLQKGFDQRLVVVTIALDDDDDAQESGQFVKFFKKTISSGPLARRRLLQEAGSTASDIYVENFIAWVAMWCTFFILLFFSLAGCHCLRKMKFKQDSLLYGKNKAE